MNKKIYMGLTLTALISLSSIPAYTQQEDVYITLSKESYSRMSKQFLNDKKISATELQTVTTQGDIIITKVKEKNLETISHYIHEKEKHCGGYFAFDSLEKAMQHLDTTAYYSNLQTQTSLLAPNTIDNPTVVNGLMAAVSESNLRSTISTLEAYQNRYYSSTYGSQSNEWIRSKWATLVQGRSDATVALDSSCTNCSTQKNVVLTITGTTSPSEIVIIGAHQDSIISGMTTTSRAPGADDDASGVAVLTEIIRVLVAKDYRPQKTVQFMAYAAEEVGLRGSNAIAQAYRNQGKNVIGVAQFDMTNYTVNSAHKIWLMTDNSNTTLVTYLEDLFNAYLKPTGLTLGKTSCGYACSDHASWTSAGFPAAMYAETSFGDTNSALHTTRDTLATTGGTANHSVYYAKLGAAFMAEMAKGGFGGSVPTPTPTATSTPTPTPTPGGNVLQNGVAKTGLSAATNGLLRYTMVVPAGATNLRFVISGGTGDADLYVRFGTAPTTTTYDCRPYLNGNSETCTISNIRAGTYHVMLNAYSAFSGVSLTGSHN